MKIENHPAVSLHSDLKEICNPIFNKTNINYFGYFRINNNHKSFTALSTNPIWAEYYLSNELYNSDLKRILTKNMLVNHESSFYVWDYIQINKEILNSRLVAIQNNIDHPCTFVEKDDQGTTFYQFAAPKNCHSINGFYLANQDLIKLFVMYIKDKLHLNKILNKATNIFLPFKNNYVADEKFGYECNPVNTKDLIDEINIKRFYLGNNRYLTAREMECMYWRSQGKTALETSFILGISKRTAEVYLENIKLKLGCFKNSEVRIITDKITKILCNLNYFD